MQPVQFLPIPRRVDWSPEGCVLPGGRLIALQGAPAHLLRPAALRLQAALARRGVTWELAAGWSLPAAEIGAALCVDPAAVTAAQGYRLSVRPDGIRIVGHDLPGVFYGVCTLLQLLDQAQGGVLPGVEIADWPDFAARGVMLDISRDRVYRMDSLFELVDRLAGWKINQLQLYTEHTFAYRAHPEVWQGASPMTGEEILTLDAFCRERFIELVPNQNSFGHLTRWLTHPRYAHLAEVSGEYDAPWGREQGPFSLAPLNPGSLELVRSLYDELLPHFTSRMLNVGCDETFDVGVGQSRAACQQHGVGRVYLEFLLKIYAEVSRRGRVMQFWGDIINQHPELVAELPKDALALSWGYEAAHPFDEEAARFAAAGMPFYVCPGTSSWCSLAGRTENALANLLNAAENGLKYGAGGYLNTDWGDRGHWQVPPVSWLGFAAGAAYSWALQANRGLDVAAAVSRFAFEDASGAAGRAAFDLGNVYQACGYTPHNSSVLFWVMQWPANQIAAFPGVQAGMFAGALAALEAAEQPLAAVRSGRADADLVKRELAHTAHLLRHAARRGLWALERGAGTRRELAADLEDLLVEQRDLWLARSRPGGLGDSLARFDLLRKEYNG